jgi:hypothetical protein
VSRENRRQESRAHLRGCVAALREALIGVRDRWDFDTKRLRDALAAVAAVARDHEMPPERFLILVKRIMGDRAPRHRREIVRWSIEAYYRDAQKKPAGH